MIDINKQIYWDARSAKYLKKKKGLMIYEFLEEFILKICISDLSNPSSPYRMLLDILTQNMCIKPPYTL